MKMQIQKRTDGYYEVTGRPIRGFDWQFRRHNGGAYAIYAGPEEWKGPDAGYSYEPSTPEEQERLDDMPLSTLADLLRSWVIDMIVAGEEETRARYTYHQTEEE